MKNNSDHISESIQFKYKDAFDIMMKSTADSVFFKDIESRFLYVSDAQLRRLNETDIKNVIGKTDFDFFPKEDAAEYFEHEQQIMKTGIPMLNNEQYTVWANGEISWYKISKHPLYDRNKNIIGTWGIATDITKQKVAEFQITEREERYRILSDVTIEGVVIFKDRLIRDLNPSLSKILGYERDELINRNIIDFVHSEDKSTAIDNVEKGYQLPYEIRVIRKNGEVFFAEVEGREFQLEGETHRVTSVRDITQRKKIESELQESNARISAITNSAQDGIIMMDQNGDISYWNPAAERILGYTSIEAIGQNLHNFIVPERYHGAHNAAFPVFKMTGYGSAVGKTLDLEARRKDGSEILVQLAMSAVQMSSGWHSVGIIRDITKQKQVEAELIKAKEIAESATGAKSEFLANMSHEIRTPMNAIIGFSGLVKKTKMTPKQQDYVDKIDSSAKSLLSIINDILDFSKIEAGKLEIETIGFQLNDVINNIVGMISVKAAEKNIELLSNITKDVPCALIGDPLRLGQILINLVNNAVKFTEKGYILIKSELLDKDEERCKIKFTVKDTGIGMTDEQMEKLFSAFSQADSSVTRKFGGTGLGLTISKHLAEMMNGEISVESEFGAGSTFTYIAEFNRQQNATDKIIDLRKIRKLKVLVVDDNEMARMILKDQLGAFGINASTAGSGPEAIKKVRQASLENPYDLVFMDWRMPGMDGIETIKSIIHDKEIKKIPMTIMVTAFGREEIVKKAESIGINTFLMKPINQSLLFDTIANVFSLNATGQSASAAKKIDVADLTTKINDARILLVEDNVLNQEVASEVLKSAGIIVEIANNGQEAVEAVAANQYDMILMDLQMPVMGGYEATRMIRSDVKNKHLPIIAMTAHAMQGAKESCIAEGMNDYVSKPIDPGNLFAVISKWIKPAQQSNSQQKKKTNKAANESKTVIRLPKSMSGINVDAGLKRLNGNRVLYRKLLFDFSKSFSSSPEEIRISMDRGNVEVSLRLAHTIKGVAGNISAYDIHRIASDLEASIMQKKDEKYTILLNELEIAIESFNELISGLGDTKKPNAGDSRKPCDFSKVEPLLLELARLVWEDNVDAEKAFEELQKSIGGSNFDEEMKELEKRISDFDFEAAKKPLDRIAGELGIQLGVN